MHTITALDGCVAAKPSLDTLGSHRCLRVPAKPLSRDPRLPAWHNYSSQSFGASSILLFKAAAAGTLRIDTHPKSLPASSTPHRAPYFSQTLSNRRIVAVDARDQTVTFTYRDYRHGSLRKDLTLSALEFIRRFSLHILPPGVVRIRHYGILGNNRRRRDIEAARAIFKRRGCAVELQPQSVVDPPCGATCCPLCGKA